LSVGGSTQNSTFSQPRRPRRYNSFGKSEFTYFGQRIASDLCGPFPTGENGETDAIVFHESDSKYIVVYAIPDKTKETVLSAFQQFISDHSDRLPNGVGHFWTDNGGEYLNKDMDAFCEEICIKRSYTVPYKPDQNPYAERAWGTLLRKVRTSLHDSGLSESFWPYFIQQAALVHNILPDANGNIPYDTVHGKQYDYQRLRRPGCLCYYLLPERDRASKLSPRALPAVHLGDDPERNGYKVFVPSLKRFTTSYHLVFNESQNYRPELEQTRVTFREYGDNGRIRRGHYQEDRDPPQADDSPSPNQTLPNLPIDLRDDLPEREPSDISPVDDARHGTVDHWSDNHCEQTQCLYPRGHSGPHSHEEVTGPRIRRQAVRQIYAGCCVDNDCTFHDDHCGDCEDDNGLKINEIVRERKFVDFVDDFNIGQTLHVIVDDVQHEALSVSVPGDIKIPGKYDEATSGPFKEKWQISMQDEITALNKNGTWNLVSRNAEHAERGKSLHRRRPSARNRALICSTLTVEGMSTQAYALNSLKRQAPLHSRSNSPVYQSRSCPGTQKQDCKIVVDERLDVSKLAESANSVAN